VAPAAVVVGDAASGPASAAPPNGVITIPVSDAPNHTNQVELRLDASVLPSLPSSIQLRVVDIRDAVPGGSGASQQSPLDGGVARPLAPPFDIRLVAVDRASGQPVELPTNLAESTIEVRLPVPSVEVGPGEEVAWLMEVDGPDGLFLGYLRPPAQFDPATQQLVLTVTASQLRGTLFLPVILVEAYVRNFDPAAHMWSSPFADAVDFGVAAPQWTRMQVLAPRLGERVPVLNAFTGQPGWIDAGGIGPVPADDGMPAVPAVLPVQLDSAPGQPSCRN
jgi:hypothetical protein